MNIQLKSFAELLKLTKEGIDDALAPVRAATAKAKANLKVAQLDEQIAAAEKAVQEMASRKELDLDGIARFSCVPQKRNIQ